MKTSWWLVLAACGILASSCATTEQAVEPAEEENENVGIALLYVEQEPGTEPSFVSVFVNRYYIRIDDQSFPNDFILFDRKSKTINNVVTADKAVYVIAPNTVSTAPPIPIKYTHEKQESAATGRGGEASKGYHYRFFANDVLCYNVVVAENFLPQVVEAFKEFRSTLAGEHVRSVDRLPSDQVDACDLALNVFHATDHLAFGFPVREWGPDGYSKFLRDIKRGVVVEPEYLQFPAGFKPYPFGQKAPPMGGG
jgi:hypothetical protein